MKINNIDNIEWDQYDWDEDYNIHFFFDNYAVTFDNIFFNDLEEIYDYAWDKGKGVDGFILDKDLKPLYNNDEVDKAIRILEDEYGADIEVDKELKR